MIFLQRDWHKRFGNASMAIYNVISRENVQRFLSKKNLFNTNNFSLRNLEYKNNHINNFLKQYFGLSQSVLNGTKHSDRCFRRNQSNAE